MAPQPAGPRYRAEGRGARRLVLGLGLGTALFVSTGAAPDSVQAPPAPADSIAAPLPGADSTASGQGPAVFALPDSTAAHLSLPVEDGTAWTAVQLPDGATLYVRYGEPGGVHIVSRSGAADSLGEGQAVSPGGPGEPTVEQGLTEAERRALVQRILREELARLRAEGAAPGAVGLQPAVGVPAPARSGDALVVTRRTGPGTTDSTAVAGADSTAGLVDRAPGAAPGKEPETPSGEAAPVPLVAGGRAPTGQETGTSGARVVREEFLNTGLFRTSLVLFESNRSTLLPPSQEALRAVGEVLREFPEARMRVEGHSDPRGPSDLNRRLSLARAEAVRDFLVRDMGIASERIEVEGYGEDRPLLDGTSSTALTLNRRVEFRILNPEALRREVREP